jgi:ribose transport system permease protein
VSPAASDSSDRQEFGLLSRGLRARESSVVVVLIVLLVLLYLAPDIGRISLVRSHVDLSNVRDMFFGQLNRQHIMLQVALLGIFAIGETIVIITGGIDLSLGSLIAFSGMVLAATATGLAGHPQAIAVTLAILVALGVSFGLGAVNANLIHRLRLPPFVVTLAGLTILRSQALLMNRQLPISVADFHFLGTIANGSTLRLPNPFVILLAIGVTAHLILTRTRIGRHVYSLGSNEQATRLSGVNVFRVKLFAYGTSALLAGVAGIIYAGYGGQGDPLSGNGYELNAVAASVIGGANLMGGQGSIVGTLLGACLLNVILSAINLTIANPALWQGTVVGGVLLLAVLTTALQQRRLTG